MSDILYRNKTPFFHDKNTGALKKGRSEIAHDF
jgi:hypothetical protein